MVNDNCPICGISEDIPSSDHDHRANFTAGAAGAVEGADPLPPVCEICGEFMDPEGQTCTATGNRLACRATTPEAPAPTVDGLTAAQWKRKYEGMVAERDDQIHRKRETRRILTERSEAPASPPPLDVLREVDHFIHTTPGIRFTPEAHAALYAFFRERGHDPNAGLASAAPSEPGEPRE